MAEVETNLKRNRESQEIKESLLAVNIQLLELIVVVFMVKYLIQKKENKDKLKTDIRKDECLMWASTRLL